MAKIKITESQLQRLMEENAKMNKGTKKETIVVETAKVETKELNEAVEKIKADFKRFK